MLFLPLALEYDFNTEEALGTYDPDSMEVCVGLVVVNSFSMEMPESLIVVIELEHPSPVIGIDPAFNTRFIEIIDDDGIPIVV